MGAAVTPTLQTSVTRLLLLSIPATSHAPRCLYWCCCGSEAVCWGWERPFSCCPAWPGRRGSGCSWRRLPGGSTAFLLSFPAFSKIHVPFDTFLRPPSSCTHLHPFDKAHFSGQRFCFLLKTLVKTRAMQVWGPADRNGSRPPAGGFPATAGAASP